MIADVAGLRSLGLLSPVDDHFARAVVRLAGDDRPEVALAAALVSRHAGNGHVCLDLARLTDGPSPTEPLDEPPEEGTEWPALEGWLEALRGSALVDVVQLDEGPSAGASGAAPLVLDAGERLYLRRHWEHQQSLARLIRERAAKRPAQLDAEQLEAGLERLFGPAPAEGEEPDWQRVAARTAVGRGFTVISGGPGTGKTFTVVKILALLIEQALAGGAAAPRATLVAPTGKAAAALAASIQHSVEGLGLEPGVRDAIPLEAKTIHRCLGSAGRRFVHDASNPLSTDIVLVDEASMVDLVLMTRLLSAVPEHARVILLGDRDQLASVEAGAVLGDICNVGASEVAREQGPLAGSVVQLTRSHRFGADSAIGALARAVNEGDSDAVLALLDDPAVTEVSLVERSGRRAWGDGLGDAIEAGYARFLDASDPHARLQALGDFRVLAAHRRGPAGVETLNREIEAALARSGRLSMASSAHGHYAGRPIMLTRNDYDLGLYNGDLGVILPSPEGQGAEPGRLRAVFGAPNGELRWLSPLRLAEVDTVFAMSVHKSQGSEFDALALVLPEEMSPVLSRELVYTGVSRARERVTIFATRQVLREAIARRVERASGLREALWDGS
jgi:exodeoxyribonuclease V alpha subunit